MIHNIAKQIKLLILDVDGVLTSGEIIYDSCGNELKIFNVKDGLAIKQLRESGVEVAIISARESQIVEKRAKELNIKYIYQKQHNKLASYLELIQLLKLKPEQTAYLGDDWADLPVLLQVGLPAVVSDAEDLIKPYVKYITEQAGGKGAVREFIYLIMKAQNTLEPIIKKYLSTKYETIV